MVHGRPRRRVPRHARDVRCRMPGATQLLFAFEAAVIGGAGSLWGTLVGGIVLGVAQIDRRADQPAGLPDRRPRRVPRRAVRALCCRRRRPAALRRRGARMNAQPASRSSAGPARRAAAVGVAALLVAVLAAAPLCSAPAAIDRLTTLFIYVILAAMWNALAGYGGLVSVGQQVFFGLGAYFAVRLADCGLDPFYPRWCWRRCWSGVIAVPLSLSDAAPARRRVRHRHVGGGGARAPAGQSRPAGARRDRHLADRAQRL